jgi:hypothetical protein
MPVMNPVNMEPNGRTIMSAADPTATPPAIEALRMISISSFPPCVNLATIIDAMTLLEIER